MVNLGQIRCFLLDMDGTIYLGNQLLPGAAEFIATLRNKGLQYLFLTNNSSWDKLAYADKLSALGIKTKPSQILTSGEATASYLRETAPGARIYLLGTPALGADFIGQGLAVVARDENPDYVVVGFDTTLTYQKLWEACDLLREGKKYLATHPDFNCPLAGGRYMPDAGAIISFLQAATGLLPQVIGKPHREMAQAALTRAGALPEETALVGDRLYTDVAMGIKAGLTSILVLSGETRRQDLVATEFPPDYVFPSVRELAQALENL